MHRTDLSMSCTIFWSGLPKGTVYWARGGVLRVLCVRHVMGVRVRMMGVREVRVRMAVRRRVAGAQVRRAAMVVERQRRAGRPPVTLLHVRRRASRRATARAAPRARQRVPPRLVPAALVALAARHPAP